MKKFHAHSLDFCDVMTQVFIEKVDKCDRFYYVVMEVQGMRKLILRFFKENFQFCGFFEFCDEFCEKKIFCEKIFLENKEDVFIRGVDFDFCGGDFGVIKVFVENIIEGEKKFFFVVIKNFDFFSKYEKNEKKNFSEEKIFIFGFDDFCSNNLEKKFQTHHSTEKIKSYLKCEKYFFLYNTKKIFLYNLKNFFQNQKILKKKIFFKDPKIEKVSITTTKDSIFITFKKPSEIFSIKIFSKKTLENLINLEITGEKFPKKKLKNLKFQFFEKKNFC